MTTTSVQELSALLDVRQLSRMLGISARSCYRLADRGAMPRPRRLGALVRWSRSEIESWLADGCKPVRVATSKAAVR
jgi:excisionase family DNA binding protein